MSAFGEVVIIEDSKSQAALYELYLLEANYTVKKFQEAKPALEYVKKCDRLPGAILLDLELPDMHGLDALQYLQEHSIAVPVIVVTGTASLRTAVEAMQIGATDFIEKPVRCERLLVTLSNTFEANKLRSIVKSINSEFRSEGFSGFVGSSLQMKVTYRIIESAARSKASVLVTGESGTGKELCARAVHDNSDRKSKPFIALNCAAIPTEIFESEMFGHVKGAFTGASSATKGAAEQANGGTLFLDEIGEMNITQQAKILRFIQTGSIKKVGSSEEQLLDVRIIAATNRTSDELLNGSGFRRDLFYRLNVIPISLPALREREGDVVEISNFLIEKICAEEGEAAKILSEPVVQKFMAYTWPGNVRELENVIRNIVIMNESRVVKLEHLPPNLASQKALVSNRVALGGQPGSFDVASSEPVGDDSKAFAVGAKNISPLWLIEKKAVENAISSCRGNIPQAAALLGVSPSTIYRKMKTWQQSGI